MAVFGDLEQHVSQSPGLPSHPPSTHSSAFSLHPPTRSTFSDLLTPYPILSSLCTELYETDLHNLSIVNKQVYLNMREYLPTLARLCLKCRFCLKVVKPMCASDLVKRCTLCREPSCWNCTWHPCSRALEQLRMMCGKSYDINNKLTTEMTLECDYGSTWFCVVCTAANCDGYNMGMEDGPSRIFGEDVVSTRGFGEPAGAKLFCMMDCPVPEACAMAEDLAGRSFWDLNFLKVEYPSAAHEDDEFPGCVNVKLSVISSDQQEQNVLQSHYATEFFENRFSSDGDKQDKIYAQDIDALCYSTLAHRYYAPGFILYPIETRRYISLWRKEFLWYIRGKISAVGQAREIRTGEKVKDGEIKLILFTDKMEEQGRQEECIRDCSLCQGVVYPQ